MAPLSFNARKTWRKNQSNGYWKEEKFSFHTCHPLCCWLRCYQKDRFTREKHTNSFSLNFRWHRSLQQWRFKKLGILYFYRQLCRNIKGSDQYDLTVINRGKQQGHLFRFFLASPSSWIAVSLSFRTMEVIYAMQVLQCALEEGQRLLLWPASRDRGREGQRKFCAFFIFLNAKVPYLGDIRITSIQLPKVFLLANTI